MKKTNYVFRVSCLALLSLVLFSIFLPTLALSTEPILTIQTEDSGKRCDFYVDGKKVGSIKYKEGGQETTGTIPDGLYKVYFSSGKLKAEIPYKNGLAEGLCKNYYEKGNLQFESNFTDGKLNGELKEYYPDGHLKSKLPMAEDKANGMGTEYNPDGSISSRTLWKNQEIIKTNDQLLAEDKEAKELEDFKVVVKHYRSLQKKPSLPEEARKYAVQAQDATDQKNYTSAIDFFNKALKIAPWWSQGHYNLAVLESENNAFDQAVAEMNKYLLLEPHAKDARAAKDEIYKWQGRLGSSGAGLP